MDAKATIREVLLADEQLRELLPNRKSFLKVSDMSGDVKTPCITFRDGPTVNLDENLMEHNVYMRIYDHPENGTININDIAIRIKELIHLKELPLRDGRFVKCKFVSTLGELEDPAYGLTFVQYQYKVLGI